MRGLRAAPGEIAPGPVPIGRPIENSASDVLDRHRRPVPAGVPGELYIGGAGVARGYLGRPDLTAERFVPDPFSAEPGARLYRTGDLARRRRPAIWSSSAAIDHQVKMRGLRVELGGDRGGPRSAFRGSLRRWCGARGPPRRPPPGRLPVIPPLGDRRASCAGTWRAPRRSRCCPPCSSAGRAPAHRQRQGESAALARAGHRPRGTLDADYVAPAERE